MTTVPSDLEIARQATMKPIAEIGNDVGLSGDELEMYGKYKAKVPFDVIRGFDDKPDGKLILVTAVTPTPAGEGKSTVTVGLGDALTKLGKRTAICLREPSLGPCFGIKGGAAGGGYAQVVPMEDLNLHFTGDFHAIGLAHNLLAAMIDNHIHQGNALGIDPRRVDWKRVLDMNDRALRETVIGLGGATNGVPRESGFDITAASEVMAILCLACDQRDLRERLGRIIIGQTRDLKPVTAADLDAHGSMAVLLKDAIKPNLVQTLENTPTFVHGGPFANIAHGCNSVVATRLALKLADYVVTEAGFGADLGAEKFMNIKCRKAGLSPDAVVIVATIRALKFQGKVPLKELGTSNPDAVAKGVDNLKKHIENIRGFGLPTVVALNHFVGDTEDEFAMVQDKCAHLGVDVIRTEVWEHGGDGGRELGSAVVDMIDNVAKDFRLTYEDDVPLWDKIRTISQKIYGCEDIEASAATRKKIQNLQDQGHGHLPICMAKTQYSLTTDPALKGGPRSIAVPIRDVRLAAGAEFLVVLLGDIMTMPGLPKVPAATNIDIDEDGVVHGLF